MVNQNNLIPLSISNSASNPFTVACPNCDHEFEAGESLRASIEQEVTAREQAKFTAQLVQVKAREEAAAQEVADAKAKAKKAEDELAAGKAALQAKIDQQVALQVAAARTEAMPELIREAAERAQAEFQPQIAKANAERDESAAKAAKLQAERAKEEEERRAFNAEKAQFELDKQEAITKAEHEARAKAEAEVADKVEQLNRQHAIQLHRLQAHTAELQRKLDSKPSQELQGEAFEETFQAQLEVHFRQDKVEAVKKGQNGGDMLLRVNAHLGRTEATIFFECKKAANWNSAWVDKARKDAREAGAEVAVIVTHALPKDVETFDQVEGVWVCAPQHAVALAKVLRCNLIEMVASKALQVGRGAKADRLWDYVTGPKFRDLILGGMEAFAQLRKLHDQDRKATERRWKQTEIALDSMLTSMNGVAGSIQALGGAEVEAFEADEQLALPEGDSDLD